MVEPALPPVRPNPCHECPWRREATPGWLGPHSAQEWTDIAHGEQPIACHVTIDHTYTNAQGEGSWDQPGMHQCAGAATYRANVAKKPRHPDIAVGPVDRERVFGRRTEFEEHHGS